MALLARQLSTPLGEMLVVASPQGLCLLEFVGQDGVQRELAQVEAAQAGAAGKRSLYWNIPIANTTSILLGTGTHLLWMRPAAAFDEWVDTDRGQVPRFSPV